jgi:hypothetical protein
MNREYAQNYNVIKLLETKSVQILSLKNFTIFISIH